MNLKSLAIERTCEEAQKLAGSLRGHLRLPSSWGAGAEQRESDAQHGASPSDGGSPTSGTVVVY